MTGNDGFTAADGVALLAIEAGLSLQPWQFDYLARLLPDGARPGSS